MVSGSANYLPEWVCPMMSSRQKPNNTNAPMPDLPSDTAAADSTNNNTVFVIVPTDGGELCIKPASRFHCSTLEELRSFAAIQQSDESNQVPEASSSSNSGAPDAETGAGQEEADSSDWEEGDASQMNDASSADEAIDLEELEAFAKTFKHQRVKLGFTQGDVGDVMGRLYGSDFSQTTISRFEALNLSFKNMCKLKPILEKWLSDMQQRVDSMQKKGVETAKGATPVDELREQILNDETPPRRDEQDLNLRRRKRRTSIDRDTRVLLEQMFDSKPKPTSKDLENIANKLGHEKEVIRVWFCNRRQREKRNQETEKIAQQVENGVAPEGRSGLLLYAPTSSRGPNPNIPATVTLSLQPPHQDDLDFDGVDPQSSPVSLPVDSLGAIGVEENDDDAHETAPFVGADSDAATGTIGLLPPSRISIVEDSSGKLRTKRQRKPHSSIPPPSSVLCQPLKRSRLMTLYATVDGAETACSLATAAGERCSTTREAT